MTPDTAAVERALARLRPESSTSPTNTAAESYTLAFRAAYADPATGWTAGTRKLVVVFGDAEPHGAGHADLAGCVDTTPDPDGLDLQTELQRLRETGRSLFMVFIPSDAASAHPTCYESIARRVNGSGGEAPLVALLGSDVALPVTELATGLSVRIVRSTRRIRQGRHMRLTVTVRNNGTTTVALRRITMRLPRGLRLLRTTTGGIVQRPPTRSSGGSSWRARRSLRPRSSLRLRLDVRGETRGLLNLTAKAHFGGTRPTVVDSPRASVRVISRSTR
jgi:hypothetical protein